MEQQADQGAMDSAIAIVGMACHLPGALNIDEFWHNLREGVESIRFYSDEELLAAGESAANLQQPEYVRAQPYLENYDRFDAGFWGFSPQDAAVTDPAHRLFLEVAYQSLEHAGHTGDQAEGVTGVFASSGASLYWMENLRSNPQLIEEMGEFLVRHTGNDMNFLATRLSYELDLHGPSMNVQTACSSALVCVHMAAQSLLSGECDMAIAGGSTVLLPQQRGYIYRDGEILSPDGHCRPFDADSAGTVFGSGAGALVLRRYEDAVAEGDTIYGVVRGSAINNDGAQKIGYLAPSVEGQVGAVAEALAISDVDAADIAFVEAHGTGTQVGDPIEFEALNQVFKDATEQRHYCRLGSVKSNIGHLGEAAGAAALIKVCLSLLHRELPASLNYSAPNPQMQLADSPFVINDRLSPLDGKGAPLLAGVTALGAGGTNAHVIVEEAPVRAPADTSMHSSHLICLSAKTETALQAAKRRLANHLQANPDTPLADMAYTLSVGRRAYNHRFAMVADAAATAETLCAQLEQSHPTFGAEQVAQTPSPELVFMFPGGGAQYARMGATLYAQESAYRGAFDACLDCLPDSLAARLRELIFAPEDQLDAATQALQAPSLTLTALFATEYAMAQQMMAWGLQPTALIGHSMGENTAACLAGVMRLGDAMNLVRLRGELFERVPAGGMLSVALAVDAVQQRIASMQTACAQLDIAAVNSPDLCVVSGPREELEALQRALESEEVQCTPVRINVAAHSRMLDGILEEFRAYLRAIPLQPPAIPFTSNLTGTWISDAQATDPDYWVQHLRNTVKFADNVATVLQNGPCVMMELGPGRTLTNLTRANPHTNATVVASLPHVSEAETDLHTAKSALGSAWCAGVPLAWQDYWQDEFRHRLPLPGYPFERKAYWVETKPQDSASATMAAGSASEALVKLPAMEDWFAQLHWHQIARGEVRPARAWLLFVDDAPLATACVAHLESSAAPLFTVRQGSQFARDGQHFIIDPANAAHYVMVMDALQEAAIAPDTILYLWTRPQAAPGEMLLRQYSAAWQPCFSALLLLAKALGEWDQPLRFNVVSRQGVSVAGEDIDIFNSLMTGPALVVPRELPHIQTRLIDWPAHSANFHHAAECLVAESQCEDNQSFVAYRGKRRWARTPEPVPVKPAPESSAIIKGRTVMVTGGLGGIGLTLLSTLARSGAKRLVLVGRSPLPPQQDWAAAASAAATSEQDKRRLLALMDAAAQGVEICVLQADVSDLGALKSAMAAQHLAVSDIHGVIHAAGKMDDRLLMEKTADEAAAVMAAKVQGTLVLDALFADTELEFFIAFSSVAAFLGLPGQIDYTAANAFLDAYIADRSQRRSGHSLVINWSAWRDVGMAAHLGGDASSTASPSGSGPAPFDRMQALSPDSTLLEKHFSVHDDWLIAEHKIRDGLHLLPGTGFIALAREALLAVAGASKNTTCTLHNVQFIAAFAVDTAEPRTLRLRVEREQSRYALQFYAEDEEQLLATAEASVTAQDPQAVATPVTELSALRTRITGSYDLSDRFMDQVFMDFGPRWACIDSLHYNAREALVSLNLPAAYHSDLDVLGVHPALLDMATGCAQFLDSEFDKEHDFFVPVGYAQLNVYGPLSVLCSSHITLRQNAEAPADLRQLLFDVTIFDDQDRVVLDITGFRMQRLDQQGFARMQVPAASSAGNLTPEEARLAAIMREAILPEEGARAFEMALANCDETQLVVASIDTRVWQRQLATQFSGAEEEIESGIAFVHEESHDPDADPDIAEVEQIVAAHKGVEQAVVRAFLDEDARRRMIAFYVQDDWESVTLTDLRRDIAASLGAARADLMPQQFVQVDAFEHDADGNIVRSDLRDPLAPVDHFLPPQTATEKRLAAIWRSVVGVPRVGLDENFFDIGGHSLLSIRVIVKVKKAFGVRLDQGKMVLLTLEQLATDIDQQREAEGLSRPDAGGSQTSTERDGQETDQGEGAINDGGRVSTQTDTSDAPTGEPASTAAKKGLLSNLFKKKK